MGQALLWDCDSVTLRPEWDRRCYGNCDSVTLRPEWDRLCYGTVIL